MQDADRELVVRFLALMEARRLDEADALLEPGAAIVFPGGRRFASQREMAAAAGGRYRWVKKRLDRVEAIAGDERSVVYVLGTLYGENAHGVPFAGVRFIDRFEVRGGRICRQEVWNDLAEGGVLTRVAVPNETEAGP